MLKLSSGLFLLGLVSVYLLFGCGATTNTSPTPAAKNFPVVVFSDVHFNPFYDPTLFPQLLAADPSEWKSIFQTSAVITPPAYDRDTNYPLLKLALLSIKQNLGASPVVIYTGDLLGHSFPTDFYCLYVPPHTPPPCPGIVPTAPEVAAMQAFTDKTVAFVTAQVRAVVGNLPVMFAVGNIDSYTGYGPDSTFLANNAATFYTQFVNGAADQQTFLNTFTSGGYYSAQPLGTKLMVIGLNTNPFALGVPGNNDSAVAAELSWLDSSLASAQTAGQEVWLLMHVPPGANTVATAPSFVSGQPVSAAMMMYPSYQASFLQILAKYPGVITMTLGAHTHMDEYRILSPSVVLDEVPAISPCFGENPAYKIFTLTGNTFTPTDYRSLNYNLAVPGQTQFNNYYTFSAAYSLSGPLGASLLQLYPELATNIPLTEVPPNAQQALYMGQYNSGNAPMNPITNTNWPVFACGIGKMAQLDYEDCVNSY